MKKPSHRIIRLFVLFAALVGLSVSRAAGAEAAAGNVSSPNQRQDDLDLAKKLLAPREMPAVKADPFNPEAFAELVASMGRAPGSAAGAAAGEAAVMQPSGPRNDRELLQAIGAGLKPSGFFVIGGQPTLVFGQKRVKAGGSLTINFEGAEYSLEITAIAPPNFTLRLNREEFTRTIK